MILWTSIFFIDILRLKENDAREEWPVNYFHIIQQSNSNTSNKIIKIIFLLFIISLLVTGCDIPKTSNALIDQESIEAAILDRKLSWTVEETEAYSDNQNIYSLRDEEGIFCAMDVRIDESDRDVTLIFYYPNYISTDQLEEFNQNILPQTLGLAGELYGNTSIVSKINKDMSLNLNRKIDKEENGLVITNQYKNDYLSLTLLPDGASNSIYKAQIFTITNHSAYEKKMSGQANALIENLKLDGTEIESSSVSNIIKIEQASNIDSNQDAYFVVKGHLENIRKPANISEPFKSASNTFISYNKNGYLIADLVDETGSMEIYLSPTAFNNSDLKQTRSHYIYYNSNDVNPFALIRYSVLGNEI